VTICSAIGPKTILLVTHDSSFMASRCGSRNRLSSSLASESARSVGQARQRHIPHGRIPRTGADPVSADRTHHGRFQRSEVTRYSSSCTLRYSAYPCPHTIRAGIFYSKYIKKVDNSQILAYIGFIWLSIAQSIINRMGCPPDYFYPGCGRTVLIIAA